MNSKLKDILKQFLPPIVFKLRKKSSEISLTSNYASWNEASAESVGYDSEIILNKTKEALLKVKHGEAVYERDSVLFDEIQYAWPLLAGLMWVAAQSSGRLNVLDFGGSLGSTFFQNRAFLDGLPEVRWNIVEQQEHVKVGKEYFENDCLKFYNSIRACLAETQPNVAILSSVLQFLEYPYKILNDILNMGCNHVIIDRTPFWDGPTDSLCVEHVPPSIFSASVPSWIFSKSRICSEIQKRGFKVVNEFASLDRLKGPVDIQCKGMIIVRS
jgi:putative methyltransferase (TIGR04325 family)